MAIYTIKIKCWDKFGVHGGFQKIIITSTIGMKPRCPFSSALFSLYLDKVTKYIICGGGEGIDILNTLSFTSFVS